MLDIYHTHSIGCSSLYKVLGKKYVVHEDRIMVMKMKLEEFGMEKCSIVI